MTRSFTPTTLTRTLRSTISSRSSLLWVAFCCSSTWALVSSASTRRRRCISINTISRAPLVRYVRIVRIVTKSLANQGAGSYASRGMGDACWWFALRAVLHDVRIHSPSTACAKVIWGLGGEFRRRFAAQNGKVQMSPW